MALAGARFPLQQHRGLSRGHTQHHLQHVLHRFRLRDEAGQAVALADLAAEIGVGPAKSLFLQRFLEAV